LIRRCGREWARWRYGWRAANYTNAGTVEFLVDEHKNFYFLEMNTRLQVEHPVTEIVTGLDLVQLQFRIASGEPLPFQQEDIKIRGHAIECRVYAEDPDNNFFPSPGQITRLISPSGPGIRRDSGMYEGWTVPLEYDPLLAKLIGFGTTRQDAINRLQRALVEYFVGGIKTNIPLFRRILRDEDFRAGRIHTGFLERLLKEPVTVPGPEAEEIRIAAIAAAIFAQAEQKGAVAAAPPAITSAAPATNGNGSGAERSNWKSVGRAEALR
jgi:acetyl-CoA carboxylase biotin carboxylase subunit